jgi:hypothetical protein
MGEPDGIGLSDALALLRRELAEARVQAAETDLRFPIRTLTVELKVVATRSKEGKAGFKVPLVNAELGGSVGIDRELVQTVTLVLGPPVDDEERPVKVRRGDTPDDADG